ncbi:MAG: non-ribosomal peptide synthetase, partial [bacterium]|nr:non-ribosomal peptide synthetase [bacterium]
YPVSAQQKRLYILQQIKEGNTGYNEFSVLKLKGRLDRQKFEENFAKLIQRHESLRTSFITVEGEVVQRVAPLVEFRVDFTKIREEQVEERVDGFLKPFDLSKAPLLRVGLLQVPDRVHILIYDMHHAITDGTSMALLIREFTMLYGSGRLSPLPIQYKDYSEWQNNEEGRDALKRQENYWCGEFYGDIPVCNLPIDYPRPGVRDFRGDRVRFVVGVEETTALNRLAAQREVTLYMLLLAIYNVLLSKLSG